MKIKIDPLDKLVSEYIRKKAMGYCKRCGRYHGWKGLQTCHFHSRRKISTRYDEDNLIACCMGCHRFLDENRNEFEFFMHHLLGEHAYNMLNSRMRNTYPKPDKSSLMLYYKQKLKELDNG